MPVGAWELEYGCNVVADPNRTAQYVANAQDPAYCTNGVNALAPYPLKFSNLRVNCDCAALQWKAPEPWSSPELIPPYTTPAVDKAPWYTDTVPESAHFWGWMIERVDDVASPPISRKVADRVTEFGGASIGRLRRKGRTMKFTLIGFGAYELAMDYGFRWLSDILAHPATASDLCDMTFRTSCPPISDPPSFSEWDTGRWTFKNVGILDGPQYEDPPNKDMQCNVRRVSFTVVAEVPYAFKCPSAWILDQPWITTVWEPPTALSAPGMDPILWWDAASAAPGDTVIHNFGSGGSALDGRYGLAGDPSSEPRVLPHDGYNYVHIPRWSGNYVTVTGGASLNLTGALSIALRMQTEDLSSNTDLLPVIGKGYSAGERSWAILINGKKLRFVTWSDGDSTYEVSDSTVNLPYLAGERFLARVTRSSDGKTITFWTAPDQEGWPVESGWVQLGASVAATGSVFSCVSDLYIGGRVGSGVADNTGWLNIFAARIQPGLSGAPVWTMSLNDEVASADYTTWPSTTGQAVTLHQVTGTTSYLPTTLVVRPVWLMARDQFLQVNGNPAALNFGPNQPFTVYVVYRKKQAKAGYSTVPYIANIFPLIFSKAYENSQIGWYTSGWWKTITEAPPLFARMQDNLLSGDTNQANAITLLVSQFGGPPYSAWGRLSASGLIRDGAGNIRWRDGWHGWAATDPAIGMGVFDYPHPGLVQGDLSTDTPMCIGWNPYTIEAGGVVNMDTTTEVLAVLVWDYDVDVNTLNRIDSWYSATRPAGAITDPAQSLGTVVPAENPVTISPPLNWICDNSWATFCESIPAESDIEDSSLIMHVTAGSRDLHNLKITVTPNPLNVPCMNPEYLTYLSSWYVDTVDPLNPAVPHTPCDTVEVPTIPAHTTLIYDGTTQMIQFRYPDGEIVDATPYILAETVPPSFPTIRGGSFCVCVTSDRCSWEGDTESMISVWTVHRSLAI